MNAEKRDARAGKWENGAGDWSATGHADEQLDYIAPSANVECDVAYRDVIRAGSTKRVPATFAVCSSCGHETFSYGQRDQSVKRCLAVMRNECPNKQSNFYVRREGQRG